MNSTTEKINQWQITKFRALKEHVTTTDPAQIKVKDTHAQLKTLAKSIGHPKLFNAKKNDEPNARVEPTRKQSPTATQFSPESLHNEFDKNQEETEFDLDSLEQEPDNSDMPELDYDDNSSTNIEPKIESGKKGNVTNNEKENTTEDEDEEDEGSDNTAGVNYNIQPEQTQHSLSDTLTQVEQGHKTQNKPMTTDKTTLLATDISIFEDTNQQIENQMQQAEKLLDKEVQEIEDMHLHTLKIHRHEAYDEYDFDILAAEAIENQWNERNEEMENEWQAQWNDRNEEMEREWTKKRETMENEWKHKCEAMELQYKETLERQTNIQVNLVAHETERAKQEFDAIKTSITTTKHTLDAILRQNASLQKSTDNKNRQIGHLQNGITEVKNLKKELQQEAEMLRNLKLTTGQEITKLKTMTQTASHDLENEVQSVVQSTIQKIVDSKMTQVEQSIHRTLQKKGKAITVQAKLEMLDNLETQTQEMEERLEQKIDDTFHEAASLLEQTVMGLGEEMDSAVNEYRNTLTDPQEKTKHIERIQHRVMNEIKPQFTELKDELVKEVTRDIEKAVKNAQDDLHLTQGRLTHDAETKLRMHNEIVTLNVEALRTDLRKEAEVLEAELRAQVTDQLRTQPIDQPSRANPTPQSNTQSNTQPTTPEQEPPQGMRNRTNNPYHRAPQVSPHQEVNVPSEDTWNQMVSKCKEKVTLTHSLPQNAKELDQAQAEAFYRQTEGNFKGYPAVCLRRFDELTRRGNSIPVAYAIGWPPEYVSEGSTILYEKLAETIPYTMQITRNVLDQYQRTRDGYQALMTIMKRSIPRLGQLPPQDGTDLAEGRNPNGVCEPFTDVY
jgi:hypothetical protein